MNEGYDDWMSCSPSFSEERFLPVIEVKSS